MHIHSFDAVTVTVDGEFQEVLCGDEDDRTGSNLYNDGVYKAQYSNRG